MKRYLIAILSVVLSADSCYALPGNGSSPAQASQQYQSYELDADDVFTVVEEPPQFPGGEAALIKYIADHTRYPEEAKKNGIEGRVVVQFVVTKTGRVDDVKVVRPKDPGLDAEAVRVVKSLPSFIPGRMCGKVVSCKYILPVNFSLPDGPTQVVVPMSDDDNVYTTVEEPPQFPGREAALIRYVADHIRYPDEAWENGIEGCVVVQFVVTKTGRVGEARVVRSKDPGLDAEAVRVVKSLPSFIPGRKDGKAVNVWYTFPVNFKIQGE